MSDTAVMTQARLESALWAAANALSGPVDPGDFKAYVFPVLLFKWVSDTWDYRHAEAVEEWGDELTDEIEADYQPFSIPAGCHWRDVYDTSVNVGSKLHQTLQRIETANPTLAGVFGDVNWANTDRLPANALTALLDACNSTQRKYAATCLAQRTSTYCGSSPKPPARRPASSSPHATSFTCW